MDINLHAEIKDKYMSLEVRLDEIGEDLQKIPFDYKLIDQLGKLDQEVNAIHNWYEHMKLKIAKYEQQKAEIKDKIKIIDSKIKYLNHDVQNIKLQAVSRDLHKDLC